MKTKLFQSFIFFLNVMIVTNLAAADLIRVQPLTNKILMVTFDEGHIDYCGIHEDRFNGNTIYYQEFNKEKGTDKLSYTLYSADDANYTQPLHPITLGRKTKGVDFNNLYDTNEPKAIKHHWIYLELPSPLVRNNVYTLNLDNFASNVNEYTFAFNEFSLRSPAIHVNQIGFVPGAPKYAYLSHFMGNFNNGIHQSGALDLNDFANIPFHLVRVADDSIVFTGYPALQQAKTETDFLRDDFTHPNVTRADVWECDFSEYSVPGEYKLVVENMGCSYPFIIDANAYRDAYYSVSRAIFTQRQGIIQEIEPGLYYPRDHRTKDGKVMKYYPDLADEHSFDPDSGQGQVQGIWGWYHDAGDHDGYSTHYRVPMTLLALYDLAPEKFGDGDINPIYRESDTSEWVYEGNNGLPDLLDEAMWLINFYKRAQDTLKAQGFTDGGVPGYVGVDAGADGGTPCWEDARVMAVQGGNRETMSYRYAACAAWLAICLDKSAGTEHAASQGWISEAENAYAWAMAKGKDNDVTVNRAKMEASAALYRYTGNTGYQDDFRTCKNKDEEWGGPLWFHISPWYYAATLFGQTPDDQPGLDRDLKQACIDAIVNIADLTLVNTAAKRGFRYGLDDNILFMLGTFSTPHIFPAAVAYEFTGQQRFLDVCHTTADYCLGGNQMDLVKVSGLGDNPDNQPFHPSSWYLIDYNNVVYTNPILPGYTGYEMHRSGDWYKGTGYNWVGDEDFSRSTAFPAIANFPDAEARFTNRFNIPASEFTIHQTLCQTLFAYGYLCGNHDGQYTPNTRPTVALNLTDNATITTDSTLVLTSTTSADVRRVEYYYDWHFIGESTDKVNHFAYPWNLAKYKNIKGPKLITAKAYDDKGLESKPTEEGDALIKIYFPTSIQEEKGVLYNYLLDRNYPNPFNPSTNIHYALAKDCHVTLKVYGVNGSEITTLVDSRQRAGENLITWDGTSNQGNLVASGVYFMTMTTSSGFQQTQKMLVIK